jgi:hypothetical protein
MYWKNWINILGKISLNPYFMSYRKKKEFKMDHKPNTKGNSLNLLEVNIGKYLHGLVLGKKPEP